jgi:hypothetical protein
VFENRTIRGRFGRKKGEVVGGGREWHNEELHNLYCEDDEIKKKVKGKVIPVLN